MSSPGASGRTTAPRFGAAWALATVTAAATVTVADALLLQRSRSYFTGGFLAEDYLTGPAQTTTFLAVSLLIDAGVAGLVAWAALWGCARLGARSAPAFVFATLTAIAPLAIADFVAYELAAHLGDMFDASLAWELGAGNPLELLAVASSHLMAPAVMIAAGCGAAGGLVWLTGRLWSGGSAFVLPGRHWMAPVAVGLSALVLATVVTRASDVFENGLLRKPAGKALTAVAARLTDVDRDGFGLAGRLVDPSPFDAGVFPYALDVPGNGLDENGIGGDLPLTGDLPAGADEGGSWRRRPDVVLVVLESFRADMIGARYRQREITPVLNRLATRGAAAAAAYSHNGYTAPSRFHLFAGRMVAAAGQGTLLDDFHGNGYTIGYFSGQDESFGAEDLAVDVAAADRFYDAREDRARRYSTFSTAGSLAVPFTVVGERVRTFLQERGGDPQPLFLYVNFHDAHFPYWHEGVQTLVSDARLPRSAIAASAREELWATYVNTAANIDRAIGDLLAAVRTARGGEPAVIVTADHGESLFDEGFLGHGYVLNDVQTRVPLVVAGLPMVIEEPFGQQDLRAAIGAALRTAAEQPALPRVVRAGDREVFQYLGRLHRPRQIAFLRTGGRTMYDFRTGRVQLAGGTWQAPGDLAGEARAEFLRLVHHWERLLLMRRAPAAAPETRTE